MASFRLVFDRFDGPVWSRAGCDDFVRGASASSTNLGLVDMSHHEARQSEKIYKKKKNKLRESKV